MNNKAQFTPGSTCTCEIVMRTGEMLDSSLGNRPCSDISRILLCPFHTAAPAMYEALQLALVMHPHNETFRQAIAQAEGR